MNRINCLFVLTNINRNSLKNQLRFLSKNDSNKLTNVDSSKNKKLEKTKDKIKTLEKQAKQIKSIGPNEDGTINKSTAKPKIFIRQTARTEKVNIKQEIEPIESLSSGLDKRLAAAAKRIANRMPKQLSNKTEKQLLDAIQKQKIEDKKSKKQVLEENIRESISYKLLEKDIRTPKGVQDEFVGSKTVKISLPKSDYNAKHRNELGLFSEECLSIFDPKGIYLTDLVNRNTFWEKLSKKEIELTLERPVENFFEEMIKWTEEGKLWHFPINNEQGLENEENVPFYEHVLLDHLLDDFPRKGPVRDFMELVIMGLSQNPYITVERKRGTVIFYKNFFQERNLLNEVEEE